MNPVVLSDRIFGVLLALSIYDVLQKKHAILRNLTVIGHFHCLLEATGRRLRHYIVTSNDEERPFATQNRRLMRGLDPASGADRPASHAATLRKELLSVSRACGYPHPGLVTIDQLKMVGQPFSSTPLSEIFGTQEFMD